MPELPRLDSFASYDTAHILDNYTIVSGSGGTIDASGRRTSTNCWKNTDGSALQFILENDYPELYAGFAYKTDTIPSGTQGPAIIEFSNSKLGGCGYTKFYLELHDYLGSSLLTACFSELIPTESFQSGGIDSGIAINTWYFIEFHITPNPTGFSYEVKVDGVLKGSGSYVSNNIHSPYMNTVTINGSTGTSTVRVMDFYVSNIGFFGDGICEFYPADGIGNYSDWTPTAGNNWDNVEEVPPDDDTSTVTSSTVGDIDTYTIADLPITSVIKAVQGRIAVKKDTYGIASMRQKWRSNSVDFDSSQVIFPLDGGVYGYKSFLEGFEISPFTSTPFTQAEFNGLEFGQERLT